MRLVTVIIVVVKNDNETWCVFLRVQSSLHIIIVHIVVSDSNILPIALPFASNTNTTLAITFTTSSSTAHSIAFTVVIIGIIITLIARITPRARNRVLASILMR